MRSSAASARRSSGSGAVRRCVAAPHGEQLDGGQGLAGGRRLQFALGGFDGGQRRLDGREVVRPLQALEPIQGLVVAEGVVAPSSHGVVRRAGRCGGGAAV
jgi:hypothetical protein